MLQYLSDQSWNNKYEKVILSEMLVWFLSVSFVLNFTSVVFVADGYL